MPGINGISINLMRTSLSINDGKISGTTLGAAEPLYLDFEGKINNIYDSKNSDIHKWLMIGDGSNTPISDYYVIKATSQLNAERHVFYRFLQELPSNSYKEEGLQLTNEDTTIRIFPKTNAKYVNYDTTGNTVEDVLNSLTSLKRAVSDTDGGSAKYLSVNTPTQTSVSNKFYVLGTLNSTNVSGDNKAHSVYKAIIPTGENNKEGIYFDGRTGVLFGAAWNDFAEFRECNALPGQCVVENGDGSLSISNDFLKAGASIVSDTYGMIIGKHSNDSLPIAVAGRVLAYPYYDKYMYTPGCAVCSAPDGKIVPMAREEIMKFPDRIVGYVSEIPNYEEWNGVKVNGRIWIKIK